MANMANQEWRCRLTASPERVRDKGSRDTDCIVVPQESAKYQKSSTNASIIGSMPTILD